MQVMLDSHSSFKEYCRRIAGLLLVGRVLFNIIRLPPTKPSKSPVDEYQREMMALATYCCDFLLPSAKTHISTRVCYCLSFLLHMLASGIAVNHRTLVICPEQLSGVKAATRPLMEKSNSCAPTTNTVHFVLRIPTHVPFTLALRMCMHVFL